MRKLFLTLFFLLFAIPASAQVTVTATIKDASGQAFQNGSYSIDFYPSPFNAGPYFVGTTPFNINQKFSGVLDPTGFFSVSLTANSTITPVGSRWRFTVCPSATTVCSSFIIPITGAGDISGLLVPPTLAVNLQAQARLSAYSDSEITGAALGSWYFNLLDNTIHVCTAPACTWISVTAGASLIPQNNTWTGTNTYSNTVNFNQPARLNGGGSFTGSFSGNPTFSGNPIFSGAPSFTGGGSLAGTFSGTPIFSGNLTFNGNNSFTGNDVQSGSLTVGKWNSIRVVDGTKFTTIAAAITDLGSNPGLVIVPSNYAGANPASGGIPGNIAVLDLRGNATNWPGSTSLPGGTVISFASNQEGAIQGLGVNQNFTNPTTTAQAATITNQITGNFPSNSGTLSGIVGETDIVGTASMNGGFSRVAAMEGYTAIRSTNAFTIPDVRGFTSTVNLDRATGNTNVTTATAYLAGAHTNISGGTIANAYGFDAALQTVGTSRNYGYHMGAGALFENNGAGIDVTDSGGTPRHILSFPVSNLLIFQPASNAQGWEFESQSGSGLFHVDTSTIISREPHTFQSVAFASLPSAADGSVVYCNNCSRGSSPCTGASTGAMAFHINGAWDCF